MHIAVRGGIDQDLQSDLRPAGLARQKTDHRRQVGPGAVAHDHQRRAGDGEGCEIVRHPYGRRHGVIDRGRERVLGRQPVFDGNHGAAGLVGDQAKGGVRRIQVADGPSAAVIIDDHARGVQGRTVDPDRDVTGRPGQGAVADLSHLGEDRRPGPGYRPELGGGQGAQLGPPNRAHGLQHRLQLRIYGHGLPCRP